MADKFILSEGDRRVLRELIDAERRKPKNTTGRREAPGEDSYSPEVYIVRIPPEGIAGWVSELEQPGTGTTSGSGGGAPDQMPNFAECYVYKLVPSLEQVMPISRFKKKVYNLSNEPIDGNQWRLAIRDKFGYWVAMGGYEAGSEPVPEPGEPGAVLCPKWYSSYWHLGTVFVSEGQTLTDNQRIAVLGSPPSGAHLHFAIGDGYTPILGVATQPTPPASTWSFVGNTLPAEEWFRLPEIGSRVFGGRGPTVPTLTAAQINFIRNHTRFPLDEGLDWVRHLGSEYHVGEDWHACDWHTVPMTSPTTDTGRDVYSAALGPEVTTRVVSVFSQGTNGNVVVLQHERVNGDCPLGPLSPEGSVSALVDQSEYYDDRLVIVSGGTLVFNGGSVSVLSSLTVSVLAPIIFSGTVNVRFDTPLEVCGKLLWCYHPITFDSDGDIDISGGDKVMYRLTGSTTDRKVYGITPPLNTRVIALTNASAYVYTLEDESASSGAAARRLNLPMGRAHHLRPDDGVVLWYDTTAARWCLASSTDRLAGVVSTSTTTTIELKHLGHVVRADTSSGSITLNLPEGARAGPGFIVYVKKTHASNTLTIDGYSGDTINGSATQDLTGVNDTAMLLWDGTEWFMLKTTAGGGGSGTVGPGTVNRIAKFDPNTTTVDDSQMSDDGTISTFLKQTGLARGSATVSGTTSYTALSPGDVGILTLSISTGGTPTVRGITGGTAGRILLIRVSGSNPAIGDYVNITHADTAASANDRLLLPWSQDHKFYPGDGLLIENNGATGWECISVTGQSPAKGQDDLGGSDYAHSAANGTWADTGLQVTLPTAGTYEITFYGRVRLESATGVGVMEGRLDFAGSTVSGTDRCLGYVFAGQAHVHMPCVVWHYSAAASGTLKLQAKTEGSSSWTHRTVMSDSDGYGESYLVYKRIGS